MEDVTPTPMKDDEALVKGNEILLAFANVPIGERAKWLEDLVTRARSDERKKYEGVDVEGLVKELVAEFLERNKLVFFYHDEQLRKEGLNPANHSEAAGMVLTVLATAALTKAYASGHAAGERGRKEFCICAAVKATDGSIYRGHRHGNCLEAIRQEGKEMERKRDSQGFITSTGRYVDREEGRKLQDAAGIPSADKEGYRGDTLFSEDLYSPTKDVVIRSNPSRQ